jgi:hypothetical protein
LSLYFSGVAPLIGGLTLYIFAMGIAAENIAGLWTLIIICPIAIAALYLTSISSLGIQPSVKKMHGTEHRKQTSDRYMNDLLAIYHARATVAAEMHNSIEDQETNANTAAFEGGDSAAE